MVATRAVSPTAVGAWVLKCNPRLTDPATLATRGVDRWCVADNYRSRLMAAGQPVLLWVTGACPARYARGFWAGGSVTGQVHGGPDGYEVPLALRFWAAPVDADAVLRTPGLDGLEVLRQPQMANPSFIDLQQWARLRPLLPG